MNRFDVRSDHCLIRAIRIVGIDVHTEALCDTRHVTTDVTERMNTQFLAFQFGAAGSIVQITNGIDHQTECQFSHSIAVLSRRVHCYYLVCGSGVKVDVIITGTGTNDNLQLLGGVQYSCIHDIRTDDECVSVSHSVQQLSFVRIFLKQREFITSCFYFFSNAIYCNFSKRLFCSY